MEHNFARLEAHILPLSKANDFGTARTEWKLVSVEISKEFEQCPCGQAIKEHCYIQNTRTGNQTYVGNVCIKRFIGIDTGNLFDGLKRIAENDMVNANEDVIRYANERGFLFDKEYDFLMRTTRKRNLSPKQIAWKRKINRRIINQIVVQRRTQR